MQSATPQVTMPPRTISRTKLPTDPLAALRQLSRVLGGSPASVSAFFESDKKKPAAKTPAGLGRKLKARSARLRAKKR
jgi:hypothetical protein